MKGKENKVANSLSRKFHISSISICQIDLRMRVLETTTNDEFYLQVKEELQKSPVCKKYERYLLGESNLLVYKGRMYITNTELRKIVMDELHQSPY